MSVITDTWHQLVRRRLWPLAILLVAALVAVPFVLAKDPEVTPEPPLPTGATGANVDIALATDPIVKLAEAKDRGPRAKVLGDKHDIFKPTAKAVKAKKPDAAEKGTRSSTGTSDAGSDSTDAGSGTGGTDTTAPAPAPAPVPVPAPAAPKPQTFPLYSLLVRFSNGTEGTKGYLRRGSPLPSAEQPLIIYLGLTDENRTAVFMIDATITAQGDGECHPTPENCETVHMQVGDTEFFDVTGESAEGAGEGFQLDLLKINKGETTDAAKAARSARVANVAKTAVVQRGATAGLGAGAAVRRLGVVTRTG